MIILGIWDGHDAGACIVENGKIKIAINEERLTRKKLDIGFPENSIIACIETLGLKVSDVKVVGCCGTQFTRILARQFNSFDGGFYKFRRRLIQKPYFEKARRFLKYFLARYNAKYLKKFTERQIRKKLVKLGFDSDIKIYIVDHHCAHAASAIFTSSFKKSLCITLDGVGDGLSGTIKTYKDGKIETICEIKEKDSIGLFFEQATTILGFRELEDEGKVMAMADYSYKMPDKNNPLIDFFQVKGLKIKAKHNTLARFCLLEKVKWSTPIERFAYMAQKTLEKCVVQLFRNAVDLSGIKDVCFAGGVAANIKLNQKIKLYSGVKNFFVFPQMGDGGLAVGAALFTEHTLEKIEPYEMNNVYLGMDFSKKDIKNTLLRFSDKIEFKEVENPAKIGAEILLKDNYLFWFEGKMEYGPRALGNRSILAMADSDNIKENLNLNVKKREWFQPFCPSILEEDATKILENYSLEDKSSKFMAMGYMVKKSLRKKYASVINVDGSARPQIVGNESLRYKELLEIIKEKTGQGIVLNTSFNIHGEPIVCFPQDAVETMIRTKTRFMIMDDFLLKLKN